MKTLRTIHDLLRLLRDEHGVTAVCYAILGAGVLVVVAAGVMLVMGPVQNVFDLFVVGALGS